MVQGFQGEQLPETCSFQGTIERIDQDKYKSSGIIEKVDEKTLDITELPIRTWTQNFKEAIEEMTSGVPDKVTATIKVDCEGGCS